MKAVSSGNPCPFLRALVGEGLLDDALEPASRLARTIERVAATGDGAPKLPHAVIVLIALIASGLSPGSLAASAVGGVRLPALRGGPLDKKGVGSRVLDANGVADLAEIERFGSFGSPKRRADGGTEQGLNLAQISAFMEANWARAAGRRRRIDRRLMNGEWPVLLQVLGRDGSDERYLSLDEVRTLVVERKLPERMSSRLRA